MPTQTPLCGKESTMTQERPRPLIPKATEDPLILGPIPPEIDAKGRWDIAIQANGIEVVVDPFKAQDEIDGKEPYLAIVQNDGTILPVRKVEQLRFFNPRFGTWGYGLEPGGNFAQPFIREPNGGGVIVTPYCLVNGELYIGVSYVNYPLDNRNAKVLGVPRQFLNDRLNALESAKAAMGTKVSVSANLFDERGDGKFQIRLHTLDAKPFNPNNRFFIRDKDKGEGIQVYGAEFLWIPLMDGTLATTAEETVIKITGKMVALYEAGSQEQTVLKALEGAEFIHWSKISLLGDGMSTTAVEQLRGHMYRNEMKYLAGTELVKKLIADPESLKILEAAIKAQQNKNA